MSLTKHTEDCKCPWCGKQRHLLTPETDAIVAADQHHLEDDNFFPATVYWRMCDLARTLERERDEWRKKAVHLHARATENGRDALSPS